MKICSKVVTSVFCLLCVSTCFAQDRCNLKDMPSLTFASQSKAITSSAKNILHVISSQLKSNPFCSVILSAHSLPSKSSQALCDARVMKIKSYMIESEGISADRINVDWQMDGGDPNIVDVKPN